MKRWNLTALPPSTEKSPPRAPGPDAPRIENSDGRMPRVLFSSPECRAVVIELGRGDQMGDHQVHERAVVQVVSGRAEIQAAGETVECDAGMLVTFEPGEPHSVRALTDARLLLILAPWPGPQHYAAVEADRTEHVPANAIVQPLSP